MNGPRVEIDLGALDRNIRRTRDALRKETSLMFVVKANAYGHGIEGVARQAAASGVTWFCVAYSDEARRVRGVAPDARILVIGAVDAAEVAELHELNITPAVLSEEHGLALSQAARAAGVRLRVHLKVDTGGGGRSRGRRPGGSSSG